MPKINTAYTFDISLVSQADTKLFQVNPTLAAGDVKISIDDSAFANLTNLPTVSPAGGKLVKVILTAAEMNANRVNIQFVDQSGAEWCDLVLSIETSPDDLSIAAIRTGIGLAAANLDNQLDAMPTALENADTLLKRDMSAVTGEATRSPLNALRFNRNKFSIVGNVLTVYAEDDVTVAWVATLSGVVANENMVIDPS